MKCKEITENNYTTENSNVPDKKEVNMLDLETVMKQIKNNKSLGYKELTNYIIKAAGPIGAQWLYWVSRRIWTENKTPEDWYKGVIMPIYKKGDRKQCENYRGIMLLCESFKIYDRIIANKMMKEIKGKPAEELHAFRAGWATTDLIFGIRQLIEKN
jgi:intergrase/recombinase